MSEAASLPGGFRYAQKVDRCGGRVALGGPHDSDCPAPRAELLRFRGRNHIRRFGATIAGGRVSIVNGATGERRAVVTDSDGGYRFPNLLPGNYKIEVSQVGFKLYLRDNVTVQVESSVRIDVAMEVGDVTQQIEVSAAAPLLQTENASLSQVVGTRSVQELPLNGRNILNLVNLVPGVVPRVLRREPDGQKRFRGRQLPDRRRHREPELHAL